MAIWRFMFIQFRMFRLTKDSISITWGAQLCPILWPHEEQHARPPCPTPTGGAYPNPCPLSQWCHPTISSSVVPFSCWPQSFPASVFIRWPKYWSFSFNISPSSEHQGLISVRMDWLALLAVQGTLNSLLQHHSSKASILRHWAFFIVQLSFHHTSTPNISLIVPLTVHPFLCDLLLLSLNY